MDRDEKLIRLRELFAFVNANPARLNELSDDALEAALIVFAPLVLESD